MNYALYSSDLIMYFLCTPTNKKKNTAYVCMCLCRVVGDENMYLISIFMGKDDGSMCKQRSHSLCDLVFHSARWGVCIIFICRFYSILYININKSERAAAHLLSATSQAIQCVYGCLHVLCPFLRQILLVIIFFIFLL